MYSFLAENFIYPISDIVLRTSVIKYYHWLQQTQWWSSEQLRELQNQKLRYLIKHAYENVPYYQKVFQEHGLTINDLQTVDDIVKLPILTKDIIRSKFELLSANNKNRYHPIKNATGGSTGIPLQYYITKQSASISWAGGFRGWNWAGYKIGDKRISFGGSSLVPNKKPTLFQLTRQKLERNLPLSAVSMNDAKYEKYINIIHKYQPKFLKGYPSSIYLLADYCESHKINDINFKAVFSTAEVLLPHYRQLIEKQFSCKVFDEYGSYDGGGQALECEEHKGFHITVEKAVIEIVDDKGFIVPPGTPGRIVVTDLYNYAMPFIRYEVGDIGILDNQPCACGRGLPLLKSIEGRTTDIIKLTNGVSIAGPAVTLMFKDCHVKQYQLVQMEDDSIIVRIVKDVGYSKLDEDHFMQILHYHLGSNVKIHIEVCIHIPTNNNKYKFIIAKQHKYDNSL